MDTSEQVVNEMIHEKVLPAEYRDLITTEINRILRNVFREKSLNYFPNNIECSYNLNQDSSKSDTGFKNKKSLQYDILTTDHHCSTDPLPSNNHKISETSTPNAPEQPKLKYEIDMFQDSKSPGKFLKKKIFLFTSLTHVMTLL